LNFENIESIKEDIIQLLSKKETPEKKKTKDSPSNKKSPSKSKLVRLFIHRNWM
jgi:hypothetical protein